VIKELTRPRALVPEAFWTDEMQESQVWDCQGVFFRKERVSPLFGRGSNKIRGTMGELRLEGNQANSLQP
jgi:hypothetical protein